MEEVGKMRDLPTRRPLNPSRGRGLARKRFGGQHLMCWWLEPEDRSAGLVSTMIPRASAGGIGVRRRDSDIPVRRLLDPGEGLEWARCGSG